MTSLTIVSISIDLVQVAPTCLCSEVQRTTDSSQTHTMWCRHWYPHWLVLCIECTQEGSCVLHVLVAELAGAMLLHFFSFKEAFENRETNPETSQTLDTIASEHTKIFVSDASYNCHDQSQFQLDWHGLYSYFSPTTHPAWLVSKWPSIANNRQEKKLKNLRFKQTPYHRSDRFSLMNCHGSNEFSSTNFWHIWLVIEFLSFYSNDWFLT